MKQRLLIVEPSELILEGLKSILDGQIRFKVLEPEMSADHLAERLVASRPDVVLINPTLVDNVSRLRGEHSLAVVALVVMGVTLVMAVALDQNLELEMAVTLVVEQEMVEALVLAAEQRFTAQCQSVVKYPLRTTLSCSQVLSRRSGITDLKSMCRLRLAILSNLHSPKTHNSLRASKNRQAS